MRIGLAPTRSGLWGAWAGAALRGLEGTCDPLHRPSLLRRAKAKEKRPG